MGCGPGTNSRAKRGGGGRGTLAPTDQKFLLKPTFCLRASNSASGSNPATFGFYAWTALFGMSNTLIRDA